MLTAILEDIARRIVENCSTMPSFNSMISAVVESHQKMEHGCLAECRLTRLTEWVFRPDVIWPSIRFAECNLVECRLAGYHLTGYHLVECRLVEVRLAEYTI